LVDDPGVLNRVGRVGVTELSLNRCDIAGFLDVVSAHGMTGVMGRVTFDAGQAAYFVEHRVDHPRVKTTVAVGVGISKMIDFVLYFHDNVQNSAKKNFPIYRLIV
jgi:hypothetical protein